MCRISATAAATWYTRGQSFLIIQSGKDREQVWRVSSSFWHTSLNLERFEDVYYSRRPLACVW